MPKPTRTEYRGFSIAVGERPGLGICVRWESLDGKVIRQAFDCGTRYEAQVHAKRKINEYHKAQLFPTSWNKNARKGL